MTASFTILALYKFVKPKWDEAHVKHLKQEWETFLRSHSVVGNLLLGAEGVNGTISYPTSDNNNNNNNINDDDEGKQDLVYKFFEQSFPGIRLRLSYDDKPVFHRLRIRLKKEIVTMGVDGVDPCSKVGTYVPPGPEWHALLEDPNTLVIDTRNEYEVLLGTFPQAVHPHTTSFVEFPAWFNDRIQRDRPQRIAMFCTGGIRCEKSTSYCLNHPFVVQSNIPVYHLEGGILAYLDKVPPSESLWQGECFVFDGRTAVGHGLQPSQQFTLCYACRHPLDPTDRASRHYSDGIYCPYCVEQNDKMVRRERYEERQRQCQLSESTAVPHIHDGKLVKALSPAS